MNLLLLLLLKAVWDMRLNCWIINSYDLQFFFNYCIFCAYNIYHALQLNFFSIPCFRGHCTVYAYNIVKLQHGQVYITYYRMLLKCLFVRCHINLTYSNVIQYTFLKFPSISMYKLIYFNYCIRGSVTDTTILYNKI